MGITVFENCEKLREVTLLASLRELPEATFYGCVSLLYVQISESIKVIEFEAFSGCTGLVSINLPLGVHTVSENAFYDCSSLREVKYSGTKDDFYSVFINSGNEYLLYAFSLKED